VQVRRERVTQGRALTTFITGPGVSCAHADQPPCAVSSRRIEVDDR